MSYHGLLPQPLPRLTLVVITRWGSFFGKNFPVGSKGLRGNNIHRPFIVPCSVFSGTRGPQMYDHSILSIYSLDGNLSLFTMLLYFTVLLLPSTFFNNLIRSSCSTRDRCRPGYCQIDPRLLWTNLLRGITSLLSFVYRDRYQDLRNLDTTGCTICDRSTPVM